MTRLKNKDGCCLLFFSVWLIFHKNNKSVSAKIMTGLSLSILSTEKSQSIQLPTYSSCGAHIRSGDNNFFSVQVASTTVCMQWPTRVFVNHSKDACKCGSNEGGGAGGPDPPGKAQVIWVSIGNKQLDPPGKSWTPPPGKCWTPSGTLKNDSFL